MELIVTVDNGISALDEAVYAKELGIDLIITDHHQPRPQLPKACAVVDPHRQDCPYPFKYLCGAGVAFKLICAMEGDLSGEEMIWHFGELAAIATVADIVELTGENRYIEGAKAAAKQFVTWNYIWNAPVRKGTILQQKGFRTKGWERSIQCGAEVLWIFIHCSISGSCIL